MFSLQRGINKPRVRQVATGTMFNDLEVLLKDVLCSSFDMFTHNSFDRATAVVLQLWYHHRAH